MPRSWGCYLLLTTLSVMQGTQLSLVAPLLDSQGYAPAAIGALFSATTVASLLVRVPAGWLYGRVNPRLVEAAAVTLLAALLALHPLVTGVLAFLALRVLSGVVYGLATTTNLARFVDEQPAGAERAHAMGWYAMCLAVGFSVAALVVGYVVEVGGYVAGFGVGAAMVLLGVLGPLLDHTPAAATREPAAPEERVAGPTSARAVWAAVWGAPVLLVLFLETFLLNMLWTFWNAWLPIYMLAVGLTLAEAGVVRTVFGVANTVGRPLGGGIAARLGGPWVAVGGLLGQCALLLLLPVAPFVLALAAIFLVSGLLRAVGVVANTVLVFERAEARGLSRGPMAGLYSTVNDLGLLSGPAFGGLLAQAVGPVWLFVLGPLLMAGGYLLARAAALVAQRRTPAASRA